MASEHPVADQVAYGPEAEAKASHFTDGETEAREPQGCAQGPSGGPSTASPGPGSSSTALCLGVPWQHPESLGHCAVSPGDADARMCGESVLLISHIIFGISHSLGEVENVIVKVFLNICLLSKKML